MSSVRPTLAPDVPKIVTGWDLRTGRSLYRMADGGWSPTPAEADVVSGDAADAALEAAKAEAARIVGAYLMEVAADGAVAGREALRERIRAAGPTIRTDLGRQGANP